MIVLMNRAVNTHIGIESNERREQSAEALERAIDAIDTVADTVQAELRGAARLMARPRSLLHRIEVRPAGRLSHCAHNRKHEITKGEPRFVIRDPGPAGGEKGYCRACALEMLGAAEVRLAELRAELE